jgi:hypothetical protein
MIFFKQENFEGSVATHLTNPTRAVVVVIKNVTETVLNFASCYGINLYVNTFQNWV